MTHLTTEQRKQLYDLGFKQLGNKTWVNLKKDLMFFAEDNCLVSTIHEDLYEGTRENALDFLIKHIESGNGK